MQKAGYKDLVAHSEFTSVCRPIPDEEVKAPWRTDTGDGDRLLPEELADRAYLQCGQALLQGAECCRYSLKKICPG